LPRIETEIVKHSDHVQGFAVLPKRWGAVAEVVGN
jgi:hypothetical protein